jgi:GAF domain-containing protein
MTTEDELSSARERIAELEAQVARLGGQADDQRFVGALRTALTRAAAAGRLTAAGDGSALLEQTVQTAMQALRATAASLYLLDGSGALIFAVALGPRAQGLVGQRISTEHGIAGWVAATGQAIAVADVQQDPRWARDVAEAIGYTPTSMAVAPLLAGDRVLGVLQVLDRDDSQPFGAADLDLLGQFAGQTAATVEQSRRLDTASDFLRSALRDLIGDDAPAGLEEQAAAFAGRVESGLQYAQVIRLAEMLGRLAQRDDDAPQLCLDILGALSSYLERRPGYADGSGL